MRRPDAAYYWKNNLWKNVWLDTDTDTDSDIDDALALACFLARPSCEIVDISTTTEVENQSARLASALCRVAGQKVPIFPSAGTPLLIEPPQTDGAHQIALEVDKTRFFDEFLAFLAANFVREFHVPCFRKIAFVESMAHEIRGRS